MPYSRSITVTDHRTNQETKLELSFDEGEVETLRAYCKYVKELLSIKIIRDGFQANLTLHFSNDGQITTKQTMPPDDEIVVLLHRLRPLILNDEHASFNRVTGIFGKHTSSSQIRQMLKNHHALYGGRHLQGLFEVRVHDTIINSDKMLFNWLNAFEYHRDQDMRRQIERLHVLMPLEASRVIFLMLLHDKVSAICQVGQLIELILGDRPTLDYS
jgi:hypothetical protein